MNFNFDSLMGRLVMMETSKTFSVIGPHLPYLLKRYGIR